MLYPGQRFFAILEAAFQLTCFDRFENFTDLRPWLHSQGQQVIAPNEWWRNDRLIRELLFFALEKFIIVEHGMAARAIDTMQLELVPKSRPRHETLQLRHAHFRDILENHVLSYRFHGGVDFRARKT